VNGVVDIFRLVGKVAVEAGEQVGPLLAAIFDVVQLGLELGRVLRIEDVREVLHQQIGNDGPNFGGNETASTTADLLHVLAILNRINDGRIRRRTANALLFK